MAKECNVPRTTLNYYVAKVHRTQTIDISAGCIKHRQVFTDEQELIAADYVKHASAIFFSLSTKSVKIDILMLLQVWHNDATIMGEKWTSWDRLAHQFYEKETTISTEPEITSEARADAFNKEAVDEFYDKLADVMGIIYIFDAHEI